MAGRKRQEIEGTRYGVTERGEVVDPVKEMLEAAEVTPPKGPSPEEAARRNTVLARAEETRRKRTQIMQQALERRRVRRHAEREQAIQASAARAGSVDDHVKQMKLPASQIIVPPEYQRKFDRERGEGLAMRFNWRRFQAPQVNRRPDGTYSLVDGQHRVYAAQRVFGPDVEIPVNLTWVATTPEEAGDFDAVNTERRGLGYNAAFRARIHARDADALQVMLVLHDQGLRPLWPDENRGIPGTVTATRTVEYQIAKAGQSSARAVLSVLYDAYGDDANAYRDWMLGGVWQFLMRYDGYARRDRLVHVLQDQGLEGIERLTQENRSGINASASAACCGAIHYAYNRNMKLKDALPPYSLETANRQTALINRMARRWVDQHERGKGGPRRTGLSAPGGQMPYNASRRGKNPD